MILASHIIVSGLLGAATQNYFLAAVFGLASHYALDAIPHWDDYLSPKFNAEVKTQDGEFIKEKLFWKEMIKIAVDALMGFGLLFILLKNLNHANIAVVSVGVLFGVLPDPLQLLYLMTKWRFLKWNLDLQEFIHHRPSGEKTSQKFWPGIIAQISIVGIVFLILRKF